MPWAELPSLNAGGRDPVRTFRIRVCVCVLIGCGPIAKEPMARPTEERRCWQRAKEAFWILRPDPPTHTTPPTPPPPPLL